MESCKRERAKGLKWSSSDKKEECKMDAKCNGGCGGGSEGEEGYIFHSPMNANGVSSRKRVKLQGKVLEVRGPADPALVPRRLRSAMNKRISQSSSPPLSDSKRRQHHASNGTSLCNRSSAERFKQNMIEEVTEVEKEVAEALTSMASLITISQPVKTKEDGTMLDDDPESKTPSSYPLEAPKDEGTTFLVPCNGSTATESSHHVEDSSKTMTAGPSKLEQPTATSISQKFDEEEAKGPSQPDSLKKLSSNIIAVENVTNLNDAMNISNPLGASLQYFPGNGMLQTTQLDALVVRKQELELWPPGPTSMEYDLLSFKQKPECVSHDMSREGTDVKPALRNRGHGQLTMPTSSKTSAHPISVTVSGISGSKNGLPTEKLSLMSANKKHSWNKCATHVHICHLIQNYQKAEKKQPSISQSNLSMPKEGTSCSMPGSGETSGSRNGLIPLSSASLIERSMLEARNRMLQDGRLLQAQQAAALSGVYAPQKKTCDLLSLAVASDTKSSGNGLKSSGQLHVTYPSNQAVMPFAFPRGSFSSQYQEQLAPGAAQQAQLQLPHYIASSQLYGPLMGQAARGAPTKQQQQLMWQAHMAHYRPPVGFPPKWQQNGWQSDSSSSPLVSQPPSIFPLPADYNPHNLHQPFILPMPLSLSSLPSRSKQKQQQQQQHNGGGLNPQSSSQLQTITNAESFR